MSKLLHILLPFFITIAIPAFVASIDPTTNPAPTSIPPPQQNISDCLLQCLGQGGYDLKDVCAPTLAFWMRSCKCADDYVKLCERGDYGRGNEYYDDANDDFGRHVKLNHDIGDTNNHLDFDEYVFGRQSARRQWYLSAIYILLSHQSHRFARTADRHVFPAPTKKPPGGGADTRPSAKSWKTAITVVCTAIGGILVLLGLFNQFKAPPSFRPPSQAHLFTALLTQSLYQSVPAAPLFCPNNVLTSSARASMLTPTIRAPIICLVAPRKLGHMSAYRARATVPHVLALPVHDAAVDGFAAELGHWIGCCGTDAGALVPYAFAGVRGGIEKEEEEEGG
ncbi:hypothetical protein K458DRAFT_408789 [Lentithecium fluviatile CBS 122367]|uniref:Extracellular membrane protein CFEM domain-containing protein n=1 Tax=Lentithecium fluviatile CBS 122367 TaxID=1168545 RepID=A0A6G1IKQ8_9PLEO|nr:hypothetical protein K458DRAFT_408789 [Lentithecium fluviatile CBS 122367]